MSLRSTTRKGMDNKNKQVWPVMESLMVIITLLGQKPQLEWLFQSKTSSLTEKESHINIPSEVLDSVSVPTELSFCSPL